MRVKCQQQKRRAPTVSHRIVAATALCALAMPSLAGELLQTLPHVWVSATALSLMLAAAASRPKN